MNFLSGVRKQANLFVQDPINQIALIFFILQGFFLLQSIFPTIRDINPWDESNYINAGRLFAQGVMTDYEWNPLVSMLYAVAYLILQKSPYWLVQSAAFGRIVIFILLWWGSFYLAKRLEKYFHPILMAGMLFSTNIYADLFYNSSDSLFAALSGLALWKVLSYYETKQTSQIGWASFLIGLAALSRNDGLIIFAVFMVISSIFMLRSPEKLKHVLASVVPFVVLTVGYIFIYYLVMGYVLVGTKERAYVAFQQGQLRTYQRDSSCEQSTIRCAVLEAQKLYGTPAENDHSIFRAIQRNPQAFISRLSYIAKEELPQFIYLAYGKRQAYAIFLLAMLGIYGLIKKRQFALLSILVAWTTYLGVYFLTFFRIGYLQTPYFIVLSFACIGIHTFVTNIQNQKFVLAITTILVLITAVGFWRNLHYLYFDSLVLLTVIAVCFVFQKEKLGTYLALSSIFMMAGILLQQHGPPSMPRYGQLPEDQAIVLLQEQLPRGTLVASGSPKILNAAQLEYYNLADIDTNFQTSEELYTFFVSKNIQAIYIDKIALQNEKAWKLIEPYIGNQYNEIFKAENDIRILIRK